MQTIETTATTELEADQIAILFEREFEGWCPVCKNTFIDEGEKVCCGCFKQALVYHINFCGCYP